MKARRPSRLRHVQSRGHPREPAFRARDGSLCDKWHYQGARLRRNAHRGRRRTTPRAAARSSRPRRPSRSRSRGPGALFATRQHLGTEVRVAQARLGLEPLLVALGHGAHEDVATAAQGGRAGDEGDGRGEGARVEKGLHGRVVVGRLGHGGPARHAAVGARRGGGRARHAVVRARRTGAGAPFPVQRRQTCCSQDAGRGPPAT